MNLTALVKLYFTKYFHNAEKAGLNKIYNYSLTSSCDDPFSFVYYMTYCIVHTLGMISHAENTYRQCTNGNT